MSEPNIGQAAPPRHWLLRWSFRILPLLALAAAGYFGWTNYGDDAVSLYKDWTGEGVKPRVITIESKHRYKLQVGDPVAWRKEQIGTVSAIKVDHVEEKFTFTLELSVENAGSDPIYAVEDSVFWIQRPEMKLPLVLEGLDVLFSKSTYISVKKGSSDVLCESFTAHEGRPVEVDVPDDAVQFTVEASSAKGMRPGNPIYFLDGISVGAIYDVSSADGEIVTVSGYVVKEYAQFVRTTSCFYDSTGITASADLADGIKIDVGSAESVIVGSLSFANIGNEPNTKPIENGHTFQLCKKPSDADKATEDLHLVLTAESAGSLRPGVKIVFRDIEIGEVGTEIGFASDLRSIRADARIKPEYAHLITEGVSFEDNGGVSAQFDWRQGLTIDTGALHKMVVGQVVLRVPSAAIGKKQVSSGQEFSVQKVKPTDNTEERPAGKHFIVTSKEAGSLQSGAPVFYRDIKVGEILTVALAEDSNSVRTDIHIYEPYLGLITKATRFWDAGGANIEAGIFKGLKFDVDSLGSLMAGALSIATPPGSQQVAEHHVFGLSEEMDEDWLDWRPGIAVGEAAKTLGKR